MREICEGFFCVDCPMIQLDGDEFTDGDRFDALNSMILLRSTFKEPRDRRFSIDEARRLESAARQIAHYTNKSVSRIAVQALERQVTGTCELQERITNG